VIFGLQGPEHEESLEVRSKFSRESLSSPAALVAESRKRGRTSGLAVLGLSSLQCQWPPGHAPCRPCSLVMLAALALLYTRVLNCRLSPPAPPSPPPSI
jgi:hypothetical protein